MWRKKMNSLWHKPHTTYNNEEKHEVI
jgi:hypothetical protein